MRQFIGLDVSLAKTAICAISEHGQIVKEAQVASEPEALATCVRELDGSIAAIGLEAGPLSQWLHHGLTNAGLDVVLRETRQVKGALKVMPIKTDRQDAAGIARLCHLGWFRQVHCKSVSTQEVRAVPGARKAVAEHNRSGTIIARAAADHRAQGRHHILRRVRAPHPGTGCGQSHA